MPKETNLNVAPYFDDFDPSKKYYQVLVKPGFPVQAREVNTLQSILQNQIESLGDHIFKEGAKVIPGQTSYNRYYSAVEVENTFAGVDLEVYLSFLVGKRILGASSGIEAIIDRVLPSKDSERGSVTFYINYLSASNVNNAQLTFLDGENILIQESIITSQIAFEVGQAIAKTISLNCNSLASTFTVSEGVYYLRGHFVSVDTQTILLDQYSKIGFTVVEEIITSDIDPSLTDNAKGFDNYAAPGADRFRITATLDKKAIDDTLSDNFIEISRIENGLLRNNPNDPLYNIIEEKFAKRTYDESGDYYVNRFDVSCVESLNNLVGNNGIFFEGANPDTGR